MDTVSQFALAAGLAWASGLRLYLICFVLGMAGHFQWLELPGQLKLLSDPWLLGASGILMAGEFIADKVPAFDSFWDALHTFIRGPGGALLAGLAVANGASSEATVLITGLIGGVIATGAHAGKASARVAINHSPEPFSNWGTSALEDVGSLGIVWLAWQHPYICLALLAAFLLALIWLLPKIFRLLRGTFRTLASFLRKDGSGAVNDLPPQLK
jgi:hypothetical protein